MARHTSQLEISLVDRVTASANRIGQSLGGITKRIREANGQRVSFTDRIDSAITRNNRALDAARGKMVDAAAGFYVLKNAISGPVRAAGDFESAMADIKKVVDFPTPEAFSQFQRDLFDLSRQLPIAVDGLAEIAAAAGEAGFAGDELLQVTRDAATAAVAFGSSAAETGKMLAAMQKSYGMSRDEAMGLVDAMNHLSNNMASNAPDLMEFWTRIAADAKKAGFAQEEAVALGSAMIASGHGADVAATSFRNMTLALTRGESATARQNAAFQRLGLDATTVARRMQEDAVGTTRDVMERMAQLPAEVRASVSSDLFGNEARALGSLTENMDFYDKAVGAVADSSVYAGSALKEFEARANTFQSGMQRFNNRMFQLKVLIGNAIIPALNQMMAAIAPVIDRVSAFAEAYPEVTAAVIGATAAIVGFRIAAASLRYIGLVGKGGILEMASLGLRGVTSAGGKAAGMISMIGKGAAAVTFLPLLRGTRAARRGIDAFNISAAVAGRGHALKMVAASALAAGNPLRLAGAAARSAAIGFRVLSTALFANPIGIAIGALAVAGKAIYDNWSGLKAMWQGFKEGFLAAIEPIKPALDPVLGLFSRVGEWFGDLSLKLSASEEDWRRWGNAIGETVGWVVEKITALVEGIVDLGKKLAAIPERLGLIKGNDPAAPAPLTDADRAGLSAEQQGAADRLMGIRNAGSIPTQADIDARIQKMEALQGVMQKNLAEQDWAQSNLAGDQLDRYLATLQAGQANIRSQMDATNAEIEAMRQTTDDARAAMVALDATTVDPVINAANIDALLNKLRSANSQVSQLNGGAKPAAPDGPAGARARGGPISRGASYMVGERGPELITASRSGYVNTAAQTAGMSGAQVTVSPVFNFTNTTAADAAEIEARTRAALSREVREMFRGVFADTSMRIA